MVITKKLKDLTEKELTRCGWIERIAYRGDTAWTMYNFEAGDFIKLKRLYPEAYKDLEVTLGKKWFAIYKEEKGMIKLIDIAKMDIGEGQEDAKRQIQDFTKKIIESGKCIFVMARSETSYFTFVKAAANGEIEILQDVEENQGLRDLIFVKPNGKVDLTQQKAMYEEKLNDFIKNKDRHNRNRTIMLERYIEELKATLGENELKKIIER